MSLYVQDFYHDYRLISVITGTSVSERFLRRSDRNINYIQNISVRNNTTAGCVCNIFLVRGNNIIPLDTIVMTNANQTYLSNWDGYIKSPDYLYIVFSSAVVGDKIDVNIHGLDRGNE